MANLSNKEVSNRPEKPQSAETFIKKILKEDGLGPDFKTDDGLFCSDYVTVTYNDNSTKKYERQSLKKVNEEMIAEYIARGPFTKSIDITGKFFGSNKQQTLKVSKFVKTGEFGGQEGGKKVNLGIVFENDFYGRLEEALEGKRLLNERNQGIDSYSTAVSYILKKTSEMKKSPAISVEDTGGRNTSRPIQASAGSLYIAPNDHTKHGALLSDIDVHHKSGKSHLSLKYGATLTFMNAGVSKVLNEKEMKTGVITNVQGKNILAAFGIDEQLFCDVFNKYGSGAKFPTVTTQLSNKQKALCRNLLSTGVGSGYWMVHGQPNQSVNFYYMDSQKNKVASTPPTEVEINYGGSRGVGKRVDVQFSNQYFDFKLNIRNKQSGLYPSHIMLDYTTKDAIGKLNITNTTNITNL